MPDFFYVVGGCTEYIHYYLNSIQGNLLSEFCSLGINKQPVMLQDVRWIFHR